MPGVYPMAPVLRKVPSNGPSYKCFQVALCQAAHPPPGTQLNSLIL